MHRGLTAVALVGLLAAAGVVGAAKLGPGNGVASSHREAPLIAEDPSADLTDVYAFRSPDRPGTVTILANVIPGEDRRPARTGTRSRRTRGTTSRWTRTGTFAPTSRTGSSSARRRARCSSATPRSRSR